MILDIESLGRKRLLVLAPNIQQNSVALVGNIQVHTVGTKCQAGTFIFVDWRFENGKESALGIPGVDAGIFSALLCRIVSNWIVP